MIKLFNRISSLVLLLSAPRAATAPDLASAQEQTPNTNAPADVPVTKHGYLDVRKLLIVCVLLMLGWPLAATADCPSSPDPSDPHFNDALREFSADMCRESDAPLIFGLDPSMKPRLQMPSAGHRLTASDIYPYDARRLSFEGSPSSPLWLSLTGPFNIQESWFRAATACSTPPSGRIGSSTNSTARANLTVRPPVYLSWNAWISS